MFRSFTLSFSSRFAFGLTNLCLPGAGNSKANITTYDMAAEPVIVAAQRKHTATVIFLHGLGDTGHGWSAMLAEEMPRDQVKYICPTAPSIPVTLNMGMRMPSWFDIYGLSPDAQEDEDGINQSAKIVHSIIDEEIRSGIAAERIIVGGFSMGGALALYAGLTYDKPLAGLIGLSSFLVQRSKIPANITVNKQIPVFMGHGEADFVVPLAFGQMTAEYIRKFNSNVVFNKYPLMPHGSCPEEIANMKAWLIKRLPNQ